MQRITVERNLGVLVNSDSWADILKALFDKGVWCSADPSFNFTTPRARSSM